MRHFFDLLASWGPPGLFMISAIDSAGIPNPGITDIFLVVLAIGAPGSIWFLAGLATLGSLVGTAIFFELVRKGGEKFLARYTSKGRGLKFRGWFLSYGLLTVFISALLPIPILPMKVFVVCAGAMRVHRWRFYGALLAGRIPRYAGMAYLGAILGEEAQVRHWLKDHAWYMGGAAVALFAMLYFTIRWVDQNRVRQAAAAAGQIE
jgi:membrane protein DedA with SNARE-associated domain